ARLTPYEGDGTLVAFVQLAGSSAVADCGAFQRLLDPRCRGGRVCPLGEVEPVVEFCGSCRSVRGPVPDSAHPGRTGAGIALLYGDLRFLAVNEAAAASNGASIEEHLGRPAHEVAPEVHEVAGPLMRRVIETGEPVLEQPLSIEFPAGSGVLRHVVDNYYPLRDDRGATVGVGSVWWEVTERTFAETVLRESEARFRRTVDPPPVLIWISGNDAKRTWFNQAWLDWTGRALARQLGDGWAEGVHLDDLDHCLAIQQATFERREPFEMEYRLRRADGSYGWVLDRGVPRSDPSGRFAGYVGSCADITELKRLQAIMQDTHERMSRLQSITVALSGASTLESASEVVLSRVVPEIGADSAATTILTRDGAHLEVVGPAGYRSEVVAHLRRRFPVDAPLPLAQAARQAACAL
ncbi:MAG: PAS domain-containing protein, partial [Nitriliruptorales bacterium]|nr:PAS domain-containing protein [Nitriliruptorales bacterium]